MTAYLILIIGLLFAGGGGELFVRGTVGIASAARISPGIIAATVAAFATSSPELTVAISSAVHGNPQIALGDALGSNVVNVALILAIAIIIAPLAVQHDSLRRDFPVALLIPVVLAALLIDGHMSRLDGLILLAGFTVWIVAIIHEVRRQRSAAARVLGEANVRRATIESLAGLVLLIAAGRLIVTSATTIAHDFGLSEFVIGATIVSIGTSVPELATAIISRVKGHDEVGLGTILGSNIYNGLFIIGVAATISPFDIEFGEVAPAIILGMAALALTWPVKGNKIGHWRGGLLLAVYFIYVLAIVQS